MASEALVKKFIDSAEKCAAISIDDLLINPDWGSINFEGCRPELQRTIDMARELSILPLEVLPLRNDSQMGADLRVCADEENREDFVRRR